MAGLPGLGSRHKPRHIWECLHTQVWFYQTDAGTDKYTHAILNPLTAGAALIRVFIFYQHLKYHLLNLLKIKCDINQKYLKTVDLHFVKSE